jgi:hypothetical protein
MHWVNPLGLARMPDVEDWDLNLYRGQTLEPPLMRWALATWTVSVIMVTWRKFVENT